MTTEIVFEDAPLEELVSAPSTGRRDGSTG
jgi:hypothetical protein